MPKAHDETLTAWGDTVRSIAGEDIRIEEHRAAIEEDENLRVVGGYLIAWGEEQRDTYGTFWTRDTYLGARRGDGQDCLVHHGYPLRVGEEFQELADVLLPPIRTTDDDLGLWAETVLDMNDAYHKKIAEMVDRGVLAWSSGSTEHMVRIDEETGHVRRWPIIEGSLTPTPANYKGGTRIAPLRSFAPAAGDEEAAAKPEVIRTNFFGDDIDLSITTSALYRLNESVWWRITDVIWGWNGEEDADEKIEKIRGILTEFTELTMQVLVALLGKIGVAEEEETGESLAAAVRSLMIGEGVRAGKVLSKKSLGYIDEALRGSELAVEQLTALRAAADDGTITDEEAEEIAEAARSTSIKELVHALRSDNADGMQLARAIRGIVATTTEATVRTLMGARTTESVEDEEGLTLDELAARRAEEEGLTLEELAERATS